MHDQVLYINSVLWATVFGWNCSVFAPPSSPQPNRIVIDGDSLNKLMVVAAMHSWPAFRAFTDFHANKSRPSLQSCVEWRHLLKFNYKQGQAP
jgi:hypothetical protein